MQLGRRPFHDIDFWGLGKDQPQIERLFCERGYVPDPKCKHMREWGIKRLIFEHPDSAVKVDVFMDELVMAHTIDFKQRLALEYPCVPLADLLLSKLQIHEITDNDLMDLLVLLLEHRFGSGPSEVDADHVARVLARDWGFWFEAMENIAKLRQAIDRYDPPRATVQRHARGPPDRARGADRGGAEGPPLAGQGRGGHEKALVRVGRGRGSLTGGASMRLEGMTAIITGAGSGIGRAIAERFAEEGAALSSTAAGFEPLQETAELVARTGARVIVAARRRVPAGRTAGPSPTRAPSAWGRMDVLVNNAAVDREVAFIDMTEEDWDEVIDINLKGPFLMSQAVARVMAGGRGGSIIHISSIDHFAANGLYSSYNVSKNGLMGLSRCMAVEMAGRNIRSNVVSPGATDTEMIERAAGAGAHGLHADRFDRVPMRRLVATPRDRPAPACSSHRRSPRE